MKRFARPLAVAASSLPALFIPKISLAQTCVTLSVIVSKNGDKKVCSDGSNGGIIVIYLTWIIQFLAAAVGGVVVLMIIIAGIQYLTSAGEPAAIKSAKGRLINAITALLLFIFMYAILQAILPGGIFK